MDDSKGTWLSASARCLLPFAHLSTPRTEQVEECLEVVAVNAPISWWVAIAAACLSDIELIRLLWWDDVLLDFSTSAPWRTGNLLMALGDPPWADRKHDGASLAGAQTIPQPPSAKGDKPMPGSGMGGLDFSFPACLTVTPPSRLETVSAVGRHECGTHGGGGTHILPPRGGGAD